MTGKNQRCVGCRFWSQMCAQSLDGGPMEALCLASKVAGPKAGRFVRANDTCTAWKSGHLGAVDDPPDYGGTVRAAYAAEEDTSGSLEKNL